eukprot:1821382-Rhodomonas_salina.1
MPPPHADRLCELELMNSEIVYDGPTVGGKPHGFGNTKWKTNSIVWQDNKDTSAFGEMRFAGRPFNYVGEF